MNKHSLNPCLTSNSHRCFDGKPLHLRHFRAFRRLLLCTAFCFILTGCGPKSDLLEVGGKISLDGVPLKSGSIRFTLTGSEKTFAAAAPIKDGQYLLPQAKGLLPGTYHLMISAIDENAPMVTIRDASGKPLTTAPPELIPAEYNSNSQKTIDVSPDGENQFNFDIVSKP